MAGRVVLPVDQAAPADKIILRYFDECGENTNMDRNFGVRAGGYHQETAGPGCQSLHNSTDFQCDRF
jgi:hypothetical protein